MHQKYFVERQNISFEKFFYAISYGVAFSGLLSLYVSGGIGILETLVFIVVAFAAWFLENSRWQLSEKIAVIIIFLVIPLFYIDWKYQFIGTVGEGFVAAGSLARLILFLCVVKLLQKKSDRDWIFIYLISFFEVLLAAGLSISSLYLASLALFMLFTVCAVITFEIRRTSWNVSGKIKAKIEKTKHFTTSVSLKRLPLSALVILLLTTILAIPLFFAFPRMGGAGMGSNQAEGAKITGFSDSVRLGEIGKLLRNDEIVMRVRLEKAENLERGLRWRGIALDYFDNRSWSKSKQFNFQPFVRTERNLFFLGQTARFGEMVIQTVYLEPIRTPVLFALSRPILVQGNFSVINTDEENSLNVNITGSERISYKVYSDAFSPSAEKLKKDNDKYSPLFNRYLQLPENLDPRIFSLTSQITKQSKNRYDKAKAVENYLQNEFGYTLDLKAGGADPLADFLFNVREGHCEYFATAMAVMLRTQGIATRIVNGFQSGEYNEAAEVYVVKQKDAHSWVEVYFPEEKAWIPFDPTPFAGQTDGLNSATGIVGKLNKYLEALETFWIQYFVAYDNQEQSSLFGSVRRGFRDYQAKSSAWLNDFQEKLNDWWKEARGDKGFEASATAIIYGIVYLIGAVLGIILLIWLYRRVVKLAIWQTLYFWLKAKNEHSIIEFYERMQKVLASKGIVREPHQTPLEFAFALRMPEAVSITEKYNRVRFGEKNLTNDEAEEIEDWLEKLAESKVEK